MLPVQVFANFVEHYHSEKHLPTVILAEKAAQAEKVAQKLDEILKASAKTKSDSEEKKRIVFYFDGKVNADNMITMT